MEALIEDPTCTDAAIVELRRLHEEMDRAVLAEYGWDVELPPYTSLMTEGERRRLEAFEDEVIDRLFVLNAERAPSRFHPPHKSFKINDLAP